jgi:hypothetical protein
MLRPPHGIDKEQSRDIRRQIRRVLMEHWDPIGVNGIPEAADEYDGYIGDFYEMIVGSREEKDIITHLSYLESEHMGLPHLRYALPEGRLDAVSKALLAIPIPKQW